MTDYLLNPQPGKLAPTIVLQLIDGHIIATTGPRPITIELPYQYGWDEAFQEETADVVAAGFQIRFEMTSPDVPVMVQREVESVDLGAWCIDVLHGKDPR